MMNGSVSSKLIKADKRLFAGVLATVLLSVFLAIRYGYNYYHSIQEEIAVKEESYRISSYMFLKGGEISRRLNLAEATIVQLEKGLLSEKKPHMAAAKLLKEIKTLSYKSNITVVSERILDFQKAGHYMKIPVELQLNAALAELKNFIYDIQSSPLIMGIETMRIRPVDAKNTSRLEIRMVLEGLIRSNNDF